jgi:hypothetical protein
MDYAFNHPSSSEAPYHIAVSSVSPPWMTYGTGPDVGSSLDPFYLPPAPTLPVHFPQDHPTFTQTYQTHPTQGGTFPWGPGFFHSSAPQDHALSRSSNLPSQSARSRDQHMTRRHDSQPWNSMSTRHQLPTLDSQVGSVPSLPNSVPPPAESESCSNVQETLTSHGDSAGLSATLPNDTSELRTDRISGRGQRWHSLNGEGEEHALRGLLPPLRSQPPFQPNDAIAGSTLPALHQSTTNSPSSRLRPQRSNYLPQMRHSIAGAGEAGLSRLDESSASFTRTGRQSPTTRPHRTSRTHVLDVQRPICKSQRVHACIIWTMNHQEPFHNFRILIQVSPEQQFPSTWVAVLDCHRRHLPQVVHPASPR